MRHRTVLGSIIVLTAISAGSHQAQAGLRFCNQSKSTFKAAVGYADEKKAWVARGWLTIEPGECKDALRYPLDNRFYYYYAHTHESNERIKYTGDHPFCVEERKFRVPQASYGKATDEDCAKDGLRSIGFKKVDVQGQPEFTINLGGADNPPNAPETPSQANVPPPPAAPIDPRATQPPPAAAAQQPPAAPPNAMADPAAQPPRGRQRYYQEEQPASMQQPAPTADPSMDPPRRRRQQQYSQDPPPANAQQAAPPAVQSGGPNSAACQRFPNLC